MGADYKHAPVEWVVQDPVILNQAAPVINQWYTVLPATGQYTKLHIAGCRVQVAGETLEMRVTVDGIAHVTAGFPVGPAVVLMLHYPADPNVANLIALVATMNEYVMDLEGHDMHVELRKTTAAGAGALMGKVSYSLSP